MFIGQAQELLADMEFSGGSCQLALWLYLGKISIVLIDDPVKTKLMWLYLTYGMDALSAIV